jgi:Arc/MetJ-type ribon-helix-helix transcriptional regulator
MARKATFVINDDLLLQAKEIVEAGKFKSLNAFIETAVKDELDRIKKEQIRHEIIEASQDPLFLADIQEIEKDFESADFEEVEK